MINTPTVRYKAIITLDRPIPQAGLSYTSIAETAHDFGATLHLSALSGNLQYVQQGLAEWTMPHCHLKATELLTIRYPGGATIHVTGGAGFVLEKPGYTDYRWTCGEGGHSHIDFSNDAKIIDIYGP